jgi:RNA-binding protein YlmH
MSFQDRCKNIVLHNKPTLFRFLSLSEQQTAHNICKDLISFYGGYDEAEYKRGFALKDVDKTSITCFQIMYDKRYLTLTHQNILGTLLSLSIERNVIGDILPKQGVFFVISEIAQEINHSFTSISSVPIKLNIIDGSTAHTEQAYIVHTSIVSSLRLDSVVRAMAQTTRKQAVEMIENEYVKVNHVIDTKTTRHLSDGVVVSIRKAGRFIIDHTGGRTRKDKIILKYRKFV